MTTRRTERVWLDWPERGIVEHTLRYPDGFLGHRHEVLWSTYDHGHAIVIARYRFDGSEWRPYVEVYELDGPGEPRVLPLPEAVHLLQNATEAEVFGIGGRELREDMTLDDILNEIGGNE